MRFHRPCSPSEGEGGPEQQEGKRRGERRILTTACYLLLLQHNCRSDDVSFPFGYVFRKGVSRVSRGLKKRLLSRYLRMRQRQLPTISHQRPQICKLSSHVELARLHFWPCSRLAEEARRLAEFKRRADARKSQKPLNPTASKWEPHQAHRNHSNGMKLDAEVR